MGGGGSKSSNKYCLMVETKMATAQNTRFKSTASANEFSFRFFFSFLI